MFLYVRNIWKARYFWTHLALADLRAKYRRSFLGVGWSILQPLAMTLLLAFVMGSFFKASIGDYALFVFSGLILWEFVLNSALAGSNAFVHAEGYIKQYRHPIAIYSLRNVVAASINLMLAFVGLILWILLLKPTISVAWLTLIPSFAGLLIIGWGLSTICAFAGSRFRDFSQLIVIFMQAVWFVSPVFFEPQLFRTAQIAYLVEYNPVYHILELFRAPLLMGQLPSLHNIFFSCSLVFSLWSVAALLIYYKEDEVIFYI